MKEIFGKTGSMVTVACMVFFALRVAVLAHTMPVHHDLVITLYPEEQRLTGIDTLTLEAYDGEALSLTLARHARITGVSMGEKTVHYTFEGGRLGIPMPHSQRQGKIKITVSYDAFFRDSVPKDPAYTEDPSYGVSGVISPEGTLLLAGADWYPDIPNSTPLFRARVWAPAGYEAVTSGKRLSRHTGGGLTTSTWETTYLIQGLALSAGSYLVHTKKVKGIPVYSYFFPEDDHLSDQYLEAAAKYLELYADLLGPYPFEKFAVVENFFPTGYGFPSYTLLGKTVIRLPFIVETSLGHEVSHAWWGNGVFVDYDQGNWSEGLTTYVADHLFKERSSVEEARSYRLKTLRDFATLVSPEKDFPLEDFRSRTSPWTHAVGYGKCLMVFHMVRRLVGDEAFWAGLGGVFQKKLFQKASWEDFARAFEGASRRHLRTFFHQWVARPGAPKLALKDIEAKKDKQGWIVTGRLTQQAPHYDLEVPLIIENQGPSISTKVSLTGNETSFGLRLDFAPHRLVVDPDVDIFRRLDPEEIPPVINGVKGSESLVVVVARGVSAQIVEASKVLLEAFGQKDAPLVAEAEISPSKLVGHDVLYIGLPQGKALLPPLPEAFQASPDQFALDGVTYDAPGDALFVVLARPQDPHRVAGIFLALSPEAAALAARKISHYGKYSYLAFRDGINQAKGTWPVTASPLVHVFALTGGVL